MQTSSVRLIAVPLVLGLGLGGSAAHAQNPPAATPPGVQEPGPPRAPLPELMLTRWRQSTSAQPARSAAPALDTGWHPPDSAFTTLYLAFAAEHVLDLHSTIRALDAGQVEGNPIMRWAMDHPAALVGVKAAVAAGTVYALEKLRKKHPKQAFILAAVIDSAYVAIIAHNYRAVSR